MASGLVPNTSITFFIIIAYLLTLLYSFLVPASGTLGRCPKEPEAPHEGLVLNSTNICIPAHIIQGPVYDPDKYNHCSIFIRYCGSIRPEVWLMQQSGTSCSTIMAQRAALLQLLVDLRQHFPDAKILGVSEIDGRELYCKNIIVSDAMNVLRRELSDYP